MENYKYIDGSDVTIGDICFYSEYDGRKREFHYADSIGAIALHSDGTLRFVAHTITMDEAKSFIEYLEPIDKASKLYFCCIRETQILRNLTKIGERPINDDMLTPEYAMSNYVVNS